MSRRPPPAAPPLLPGLEESLADAEAAGGGHLPGTAHRLLTGAEEARRAVAALADGDAPVGLALVTAGPDPLADRARLLALAPARGGPALLVDLDRAGGLEALRGPLDALRAAAAHDAAHAMAFLRRAGVRLTPDCARLASHALAGEAEPLPALARRHLGLDLGDAPGGTRDRGGGGVLAEAGPRRAALEAAAARDLLPVLAAGLERRGAARAYGLARDAQPAVTAMRLAGMPLDAAALSALAARLAAGRDRLRAPLADALDGRNPDSGPRLAAWLEEALGGRGADACRAWPRTGTGRLATDADALARGAPHLPPAAARVVLDLLLPYKAAERRRSWLAGLAAHAHPLTGRLHARHDLAGTVSGRMSSADPNMQAVPRDAAVRALFRAPPGRALVVADYSQMELRVAALLAGEERLLAAHRAGRDAHVLTAAALLGKAPEAVTRDERRLAKAANFGLLYGQGAEGLRAYAASAYGVAMTAAEARRHRAAWFRAHPAFQVWQARVRAEAGRTLVVRTPAGRERRWAAGGFRATQALSHPVQGAAAEVLLAALARLRRGLEAAGLDAAPVAAVHDELVVEAAAADAPAAARVLEEAMVGGMLEVLPGAPVAGLVAARVGPSWAGGEA